MKTITTSIALSVLAAGVVGAQAPRLAATPARPEPGAVVRLTLNVPASRDSVVAVRGTLAEEPLHFLKATNGVWHAIGGVPVDAEGNLVASAVVTLSSGKTETARARFTLPKIPPPVAKPLAVDSSFTKPLDAATIARINSENARAREIGRNAHHRAPMWTAAFLRPRSSVITSEFGSGRVFNGRLTSRHLGVDFRGAVGEPIRAANRGVVALVDHFFLAGNVIYVDHGGGVVTSYFHLSKPLVATGDTVTRGEVIGLVGNTGRVTGPHLHWAARYGALTVNPLDLVSIGSNWYSGSLARPGDATERATVRNQGAGAPGPRIP